MKVGIMTWHEYYNYGTTLQLYAMVKTIQKLGQDPYVVNYHTRTMGATGETPHLYKKFRKKADQVVFRVFDSETRRKKFEHFIQENIVFTDLCDTLPELERLNDWIDCFVCGSDQIWSPKIFDPHFFLDFVWDSNRTIAYAPSVGLPQISNEYVKSQIKEVAERIRFLSTREESGSSIISDLTGRDVATVLDPTFLLTKNDWEEICCKDNRNKPYLLVYMLGHNKSQWNKIYKIASILKYDVVVIPVFEKDQKRPGCLHEPVGPNEFLGLINNASFVCTDSFHATAFSIIFQKEFLVFERFKEKSELNQNSRIYNILQQVKLKDRLYSNDKALFEIINKKIDYPTANMNLDKKRRASLLYLSDAIEKVRGYKNPEFKKNIKHNLTLCCGCGACMVSCPVDAIRIKMDDEGFYTSTIDNDKCISCGACRKVCPYITGLGGEYCKNGKLYSYKDNSVDVLMKSSSGGAAYDLSRIALLTGYKIIGSTFDRNEQKAKHIVVEKLSNLYKLQGSKYIQSNFSVIAESLRSKEDLMIFGTPCQIAAAKRLHQGNNSVFVDLICHGIPSYFLFEEYANYLNRKHNIDTEKMDVIFRYKPRGWKERYIYVTDTKKSICTHQDKDPYFLCFEYSICYSKNCFECPWRDKSQADLRVGDYWNSRFDNDKTGVSMILALTPTGQEWIKKLAENNMGCIKEGAITDYTDVQQMVNTPAPLFRKEAIMELKEHTPIENIVDKYVYPLYREKEQVEQIGKLKNIIKKVIKHNG